MAAEGPQADKCNVCIKAKHPQLQAAKKGHVQCLMASLERAGLVDKKGRYEAMEVDEFGATALHHCCRHDQVQCLSVIVKLAHVKECVRARNGATALHDAAATGSVRCLSYLLEHTQHDLLARDKSGSTPLHWAVQGRQEASVAALLQASGISCLTSTRLGVTPVHVASAKNHLGILKLLVNFCLTHDEESAINTQAKSGATAAYFAAQEGSLDCLQYLAMVGGADLTLRAKDKMMCLHAAAQHGNLDCLKWILHHGGAQHANDRGPDNASIAHFAASQGNNECLDWILTDTVLTGKERDHFGATPLHDAADNNRIECVRCLLSHEVLAVAADNEQNTPMDLAKAAGHTDIATCIQEHMDGLQDREKQRQLAVLKTKHQEDQERKRKQKVEKQRKKEQEKMQKMQAKLKQEEEKQRQRELKRQQLEASIAAESGLATEFPVDALNSSGALSLPSNPEDWTKLEDEAHALALQAELERGGSPAAGEPDDQDDKLNVSGSVSFRLSENGEAGTSGGGGKKKREKKEKAKTHGGLSRLLKRKSTDREIDRSVSRHESHSSTGTDHRVSSPGSLSSLATPGSSRGNMQSTDNVESGDDDDDLMASPKPHGYVKTTRSQYESQIKDRQSHFSRFWKRRDPHKQPAKERPRSAGKKERPGSAGRRSNDRGNEQTAAESAEDVAEDMAGSQGLQATPPKAVPPPLTKPKSRFSMGLANLLNRGNRSSASVLSPTLAGAPEAEEVLINEAALDNPEPIEDVDGPGASGPDTQPQQNRVMAEAAIRVGESESDDDQPASNGTLTVSTVQKDRKQSTTSGIVTDLSTGLLRDTHQAWPAAAAADSDGSDGTAATATGIEVGQESPPRTESSASVPEEEEDTAESQLRKALAQRQASLATAILMSPTNASDPAMPSMPSFSSTPTKAERDDAPPQAATSRDSEDQAVEGKAVLPSKARSMEHLSSAGRDSDQLFDSLKTRLFEDEDSAGCVEPSGSSGLDAALRGASSMEYIAGQREGHLPASAQGENGLEAALFNASSMEHLAGHRESREQLNTRAPEKVYTIPGTQGLEQILLVAESDIATNPEMASTERLDLSPTADEGPLDISQLTHRPTAIAAHVGEDMLPASRTSVSLTTSTGTLDTIDECDNEPSDTEQPPEDKQRHPLALAQQRTREPCEDGAESGRLSNRSSSLPALVESGNEQT